MDRLNAQLHTLLEANQQQALPQGIDGDVYHKEKGKEVLNERLKPLGIYDSQKQTVVFKLRKLLVDVAEAWAKFHSIKQTMIQSGQNNLYIKPVDGEKEAHLTKEKAIEIYDVTAKKLGYRNDVFQKGNWFKTLL